MGDGGGARLPTVHDVARQAGVSRQTVSNVLNAPDVVRPQTRDRVLQVIEQLGYRPHASARRLRTQRSSTLGVRLDPVTDGINGAVLDAFLHALTEQADRRGLRILVYTATSPEDEIEQFRRLLDGADVDAFVLSSTFHGDPRTRWLSRAGASFVTFGRPWGSGTGSGDDHPWVDVDGRLGTAEATRALLDRGAVRVAHLGWPSPSGTGDERRLGWEQTVSDVLGPAARRELDLRVQDSVAGASEAVGRLVQRHGAPDAVVCASDTLALGATLALGRSVPVIGFDNTPVAAALGLSSVEQPLQEVAAACLELLAEPGAGERTRLLGPRVVWREPLRLER